MGFEVDEKIEEEVRKHKNTSNPIISKLRDIITSTERVIKDRKIELAQENGIIVLNIEDLVTDDMSDMQVRLEPIQEGINGYFTPDGKMLGYYCSSLCDGIVKGAPKVIEAPEGTSLEPNEELYECRICGNYLSSRRPL